MPSFIKSDNHITLVFEDGETSTVYISNENYGAVCAAVREGDWDQASILSQPAERLKLSFEGIDSVAIVDGIVTFDDLPMHSTLTERMINMHSEGFDVTPMAHFLENLMENPSYRAVNELYTFLEKSDLPITEDGHFLAYKRINNDYKDIHSNMFDNSPGTMVEMRRNSVNEDKNQTCSAGLHFCSRDYLPHYGTSQGNRVVMIKINPRDVVAIPTDYQNAKGRCCKYYVVKELQIDFDTDGNLPEEIEAPYTDSRIVVGEDAVEQLNLAEAILGDGEPKIIASFDNATAAMHKVDIDSSSITKVCNGDRRSAGGFAWRWASDNPANRLAVDEADDDFGCFGDYFGLQDEADDFDYHE